MDLKQYSRVTRVHRAVREHLMPSRCINRHRPVSPFHHSGHTECVLHTQVTSYYSNFQSIRYKYTQQIASDKPSVMMGIDWPDDGYWSAQMRCHPQRAKLMALRVYGSRTVILTVSGAPTSAAISSECLQLLQQSSFLEN